MTAMTASEVVTGVLSSQNNLVNCENVATTSEETTGEGIKGEGVEAAGVANQTCTNCGAAKCKLIGNRAYDVGQRK
jgi:hypothetical protein